MAGMRSGKCRARGNRSLRRILLAAILVWVSSSCPGTAQQWDTQGAEAALKQAREFRKNFSPDRSADTNTYLRCIRLYERVYSLDPHFSGSDDAIYEAATLYQEMAARFQASEYDTEAAKLLRFLIKDYPASQYRSYAILRLAAMGPTRAGPSTGVPGKSQAQQGTVQSGSKPGSAPTQPPAPQEVARAAAVRGIQRRATAEYTRVTIDLDERASYQMQRISDPDRVFIDFSNTWLVLDTSDKVIAVNDPFLRRIRAAQNQPGVVRVVLELRQDTDFKVSELANPFRVVIDIRKRSGSTPAPPVRP